MRGYLLQYLTSRPSVAPYVRNQMLHTVALLVKRATLEVDCEQLFGSLLDSVAQMLASGDVITVGVVGEWSTTSSHWALRFISLVELPRDIELRMCTPSD